VEVGDLVGCHNGPPIFVELAGVTIAVDAGSGIICPETGGAVVRRVVEAGSEVSNAVVSSKDRNDATYEKRSH
jgi:hypothetical protein